MATKSKDADILCNANLRLCRLRKWSNYKGFGFNLERSPTPPHIIQSVDLCSPADAAGLQILDAVLAVNNQDISDADYSQARDAIKHALDTTNGVIELLVVEERHYRSLKKKNVKIDSKFAQVINAPPTMPANYDNFFTNQPRSCTIHSSGTNETFGFEIADGRDNIGVYVSEIYPNTSASKSSLQKNDRIIEINDIFVDKDVSKSIFKKLDKAKTKGTVKLYVIDVENYIYYKRNNIPLSSKKYRNYQMKQNHHNTRQNDHVDDEESLIQPSSQRRNIHSSMAKLSIASDNIEPEIKRSTSCVSVGTLQVRKRQYKPSFNIKNAKPSINVCRGDLITQQTDVIVVCSSSQSLFESICDAGGASVLKSYNAQSSKTSNDSIIVVDADGKIASKKIYFLPWKADSDTSICRGSIKKFVSDAIEKATQENCQSIAFPAIGCGKYGCSISLVAQTMIEEADRQLFQHGISVLFVIQPENMDIYNEFQKQIYSLQTQQAAGGIETISTSIGGGTLAVEEGDITMQNVDVIIGSSSSESLRKAIIKAAGNKTHTAFDYEYRKNPNSLIISTVPGDLSCKRIFFINWQPNVDEEILQQSLIDLISTVIQNVASHNFTSIAFPAIGCGQHGCSVQTVVKTMVKEMKTQLTKRNLSWTVKFIVQPGQHNVYDEFCKQILTTQHDESVGSQGYQVPSTWEKSTENKKRFTLSTRSDEYTSIVSNFDQAMKGSYKNIIRIERIQNERWYMQYLAHSQDFKGRLKTDTEKRLYHGCSDVAASSIIEDCFNRSFAGVNGELNVYFFGK